MNKLWVQITVNSFKVLKFAHRFHKATNRNTQHEGGRGRALKTFRGETYWSRAGKCQG